MVHQYLSYRTEAFFNAQIKDGLYNVKDLTEVKIPANMPGVNDWTAYEKVSGSIQFANEAYNYVAIRVTRTAIYLKCLPNYETTRLSDQNVIHAENIDLKIPKKEHVPYGKTTLTYNLSFTFIKFEFNSPFKSSVKRLVQPVSQIICHSLDIPEQPPKSIC
ncbi:hypothetical protein [Mucilaginibacter sp. OK098]|uniref:hypothetical protein n=1 Tax=Mucilaginibacter sp. OK098 TaxID=1855297 RepID=UPI00091844CC|nr:hypothetical protein [Mucilaginibacter sp. OK098]SHN23636.1 hypothetical protein SAMN05216524_10781 [Mucilaginibacter sp. OK098]